MEIFVIPEIPIPTKTVYLIEQHGIANGSQDKATWIYLAIFQDNLKEFVYSIIFAKAIAIFRWKYRIE